MQWHASLGALLALWAGTTTTFASVPFTAGNLLVSSGNQLRELTPAGALVQAVPIPSNTGEVARDLVMTEDWRIAVYNGTFTPQLSVYDGALWADQTLAGWSTANNVSYGGITASGDHVYATDMDTAGGPEGGIVRFDLATGTAERFLTGQDYIDVALGQDGKLYGLRNTYGALDVIDPGTMTVERQVSLGHTSESRAIAVNAAGEIFMAGWYGDIVRYSPNGEPQASLVVANNLTDIDLNDAGMLAVAGRFGDICTTDQAFSQHGCFSAGTEVAFVAWVLPRVSFRPGNILVASNWTLHELTRNGQVVQSLAIPANGAEVTRDLIVTADARIGVYNGTFTPVLSLFDGRTWQSRSLAGWSTINNVSYGGIATLGDAVYATDMATRGGPAAGIVRFDLAADTAERGLDGRSYIDLTLGWDGKLYGLRNTDGDLEVIDPTTLVVERTLDLGQNINSRAIAVDATGEIFMASWSGRVVRYAADGRVLASLLLRTNLVDIDLNAAGKLVVGGRYGQVFVTDRSFAAVQSHTVSDRPAFVTWVPEPGP